MIYNNSSFWLDDDFLNDDVFSFDKDIVSHNQPKSKDPVKLSGYRRAIGNFVRIVTGQPIPVRFTEAGDSYTDGESVTISASLKDKKWIDAFSPYRSHELIVEFIELENEVDRRWLESKLHHKYNTIFEHKKV